MDAPIPNPDRDWRQTAVGGVRFLPTRLEILRYLTNFQNGMPIPVATIHDWTDRNIYQMHPFELNPGFDIFETMDAPIPNADKDWRQTATRGVRFLPTRLEILRYLTNFQNGMPIPINTIDDWTDRNIYQMHPSELNPGIDSSHYFCKIVRSEDEDEDEDEDESSRTNDFGKWTVQGVTTEIEGGGNVLGFFKSLKFEWKEDYEEEDTEQYYMEEYTLGRTDTSGVVKIWQPQRWKYVKC